MTAMVDCARHYAQCLESALAGGMGGRDGKTGMIPSKIHRNSIENPSKFLRNNALTTP
jgi:hypothetical protein